MLAVKLDCAKITLVHGLARRDNLIGVADWAVRGLFLFLAACDAVVLLFLHLLGDTVARRLQLLLEGSDQSGPHWVGLVCLSRLVE